MISGQPHDRLWLWVSGFRIIADSNWYQLITSTVTSVVPLMEESNWYQNKQTIYMQEQMKTKSLYDMNFELQKKQKQYCLSNNMYHCSYSSPSDAKNPQENFDVLEGHVLRAIMSVLRHTQHLVSLFYFLPLFFLCSS